jgi:glutamyl-tRNA(Gln) amidotransferase subunit E
MIHSESPDWLSEAEASRVQSLLGASVGDAQLLFWGPDDDMSTALETVEERCRLAFDGVPNETRKSFVDGTTIFERVLPGPDRMYPDTDSAPIAIAAAHIARIRDRVIGIMPDWLDKLRSWGVPADSHYFLISRRLVPLVEEIVAATGWPDKFVALLFAHTLKGLRRRYRSSGQFNYRLVVDLCMEVHQAGLDRSIVKEALSALFDDPSRSVESAVHDAAGESSLGDAIRDIPVLAQEFDSVCRSRHPEARVRWIVGQLKKRVLGRTDLSQLAALAAKELGRV